MKTLLGICFIALSMICHAQEARWYILNLGGKPVGYYKEAIDDTESETITTFITMKMKLSRLGSEVNLESVQSVTEKKLGELIRTESKMTFSAQTTSTLAEVIADGVKVRSSAGNKETENTIPFKGKLLGNEGTRLLTMNLKQVGDSISFKTFIPDFGMVAEGKRKYLADEYVDINGANLIAKKISDTFIGLPVNRISWIDQNGVLLKSVEPNPFGQMMLVKSNQKSAEAIAMVPAELSEDQYTSTIARSNIRLPQAREIESVTLKMVQRKPELGFPDMTGAYQQILEKGKNYVIIKIDRPTIGGKKEVLSSRQMDQYLLASSHFNTEDTLVVRTAKTLTAMESDPWKKTLLIRNWVNKNMKFDPGIALASSSEVIRNMSGTCVSFATITTTLCRAAKIPSRYIAGYVYVDGMWGGHAWTEVYIDNSWIPVDAAMTSPKGVSDAARFHFARVSGQNGLGETLIGGSQLYSNVEVKIVEYRLNGKIIKPSDKIYTVDTKGYSNTELGLNIRSIRGFEFSEMDQFYPDNTLVSMVNRETNETVKIYQRFISPRSELKTITNQAARENKIQTSPMNTKFGKYEALECTSQNVSLIAIMNENDVFVVVANGAKSKELLDNALDRISIGRK